MPKKKKIPKNRRQEIKRLILYSITGGAWFWSGYLMFAFCDIILDLDLWWSKLLANIFGITVNFILERLWVFRDSRKHKRLTVVTERYILLTLVNFLIDYLIVLGLRDILGITPYLGQFISAGFFYVWNYLWYRFWVFASHRKGRRIAA